MRRFHLIDPNVIPLRPVSIRGEGYVVRSRDENNPPAWSKWVVSICPCDEDVPVTVCDSGDDVCVLSTVPVYCACWFKPVLDQRASFVEDRRGEVQCDSSVAEIWAGVAFCDEGRGLREVYGENQVSNAVVV